MEALDLYQDLADRIDQDLLDRVDETGSASGPSPMRELRCPFCGTSEEEGAFDFDTHGLDLTHCAGGTFVDWRPCCEGMREEVGAYGWAACFGVELAEDLRRLFGEDVREVWDGGYVEERGEVHARPDDYLVRFPLEVHARHGESGWRDEVFELVDRHHRHHGRPVSWKFGVAVHNGSTRVGVACVGRPVSRMLMQAQPDTLEVTRVCVFGDRRLNRNASSKLYGACAQEARRRGAKKLITYTLETEEGASLRASGFVAVAKTRGGSWNRLGRARTDKAPTCRKIRWERAL